MVSRMRMKIDLLAQSVLIALLSLATPLDPLHIGVKIALIILLLIQMLGAAQLWLWHAYRLARVYLFLFFTAGLLLPIGLHFFNLLTWLLILILALVYYVQTIRMATVVLRRPRSFWDLS